MSRHTRHGSALAVSLGLAPFASGQGYSLPDQGARASGQGEAFAAVADDPSAIYYNPAGLTQLEGSHVMAGVYAVRPDTEFVGPQGADRHRDIYYVPHLYLTTGIDRGISFGLGVNSEYGLGVDWADDGPLRAIVTESTLEVVTLSPTLSFSIAPAFSVGASVNLHPASLRRESVVPIGPGAEGRLTLDTDAFAASASAGVLWRINDEHSLALVYKSGFDWDFSGAATLVAGDGSPVAQESIRFTLSQPDILTLAWAWRLEERVTLSVDVVWQNWSDLDDVQLSSSGPVFASLPAEQFDYDPTWSPRIGLEYRPDSTWSFRCGYGFFEGAPPASTFSPLVPNLDSHLFTLGAGYDIGTWRLDVALQAIYRPGRDIVASVNSPPGSYSDLTLAVMASLSFSF